MISRGGDLPQRGLIENITRVNQLVRSDRRLTVQMLSKELSLSTESADTCDTSWLFHYDSTPAHKAISVKRLLAKKTN